MVQHDNATAMLNMNREQPFFPLIFPSCDLSGNVKASIHMLQLQSTNLRDTPKKKKKTFLNQKKRRKVI